LFAELIGVASVDNKGKDRVNGKKCKENKKADEKCFERFLKMNAYDLALEDPFRAYIFLFKEVMGDGEEEGSVKEKRDYFNRLLLEIVELLEENGYLKVAKDLLNHYKILERHNEAGILTITKPIKPMIDDDIKTSHGSITINAIDEQSLFNVVRKEYLYDFESWLKVKKNRALMNFAYAFWVDGSEKEAKSFLEEQIYTGKEGENEGKERILKTAINYLKLLLEREIGNL